MTDGRDWQDGIVAAPGCINGSPVMVGAEDGLHNRQAAAQPVRRTVITP